MVALFVCIPFTSIITIKPLSTHSNFLFALHPSVVRNLPSEQSEGEITSVTHALAAVFLNSNTNTEFQVVLIFARPSSSSEILFAQYFLLFDLFIQGKITVRLLSLFNTSGGFYQCCVSRSFELPPRPSNSSKILSAQHLVLSDAFVQGKRK